MKRPIFLGDETSAAAYRLAGVDARAIAEGGEPQALDAACDDAPLVIVAASVAARLPPRKLQLACAALEPLVVVVPDLDADVELPDIGARLRRQLGIAEEAS
jgi:vacuolar-type H+-ATPase subunit F/Vma7